MIGFRGQTPLVMHDAELSVPFGAAKGQIALVENQLLFVVAGASGTSIAIDRADITSADRSGEVVTLRTRRSLRDAVAHQPDCRLPFTVK